MKDSQGQVQRQPQVSSTRTGDWLLEHEGLGPWSQLTLWLCSRVWPFGKQVTVWHWSGKVQTSPGCKRRKQVWERTRMRHTKSKSTHHITACLWGWARVGQRPCIKEALHKVGYITQDLQGDPQNRLIASRRMGLRPPSVKLVNKNKRSPYVFLTFPSKSTGNNLPSSHSHPHPHKLQKTLKQTQKDSSHHLPPRILNHSWWHLLVNTSLKRIWAGFTLT